jgi:micrococcal nuclease
MVAIACMMAWFAPPAASASVVWMPVITHGGRPSATPTPTPLPDLLPPPGVVDAYCYAVHDGDTITCKTPTGMQKVRLLGIDAPELKQLPWGPKAQAALQALVYLHNVRLDTAGNAHPLDLYGRTLAYVYVDGTWVQEKLVTQGLAMAKTYGKAPRDYAQLDVLMRQAKNLHVGIWSDPAFVLPSDYRKQHGIGKH